MNRFYATLSFHCALLLGVSQSAQALVLATSDSLAGADTARSYTLNEVLVTSTRLTQFASLSSSAVTVLSSKDIQSANATSLAQLLLPINGLFIKDYGGNSGLKTIAQRGFGPEHTLLLINGMRVSNAQNSLSDLSLISADEISRVEVLHGGQSASFGADAVAGAVNISTLDTLRDSY